MKTPTQTISTDDLTTALNTITDGMKDSIAGNVYERFSNLVEIHTEAIQIQGFGRNSLYALSSTARGQYRAIGHEMRNLFNSERNPATGDYDETLKANWMEIAAKVAHETAENTVEGFRKKNAKKAEGLLNGRKASVTGHVYQDFTGFLNVKVADGSKFTMNFNITYNNRYNERSGSMTYFMQFPTRFADVVFADGSGMDKPSEAKMKEAAKAAAPKMTQESYEADCRKLMAEHRELQQAQYAAEAIVAAAKKETRKAYKAVQDFRKQAARELNQ
jgi:hypothetical protein